MKFEAVRAQLDGIPFTPSEWAEVLYKFIIAEKPAECLELGFAHGVSSCYIAAALEELGRGHLTSVDLLSAVEWQEPRIEELLLKTGLQEYVTVVRERTSYNWFLKKKIEQNSSSNNCQPIYDFCFIDGAKNWTIDGLAFFLVDKLLKPDGWILFDDLRWTYGSTATTQTDGISHRQMGEDELHTPHIELIYRLLVLQHPDYSEFRIQSDWWAWARKTRGSTKTLTYNETYTYKAYLFRVLRKLAQRVKEKRQIARQSHAGLIRRE